MAEVPRTIHYQGKLTEPDGSPLVGEHTVTIRLYDAATEGAALWKEDHAIDLRRADNGVFSIVLGSITPFSKEINFNSPLWLTTEVDGAGEFLPRQPLSAVGYAINADTLDGLDSTQLLGGGGAGDITSVVAGTGLTGGGVSADVTLDIGAGTGILVGSDAISVDVGTAAGKIVQLDPSAALPVVSGANLTTLNADSLATGTVSSVRLAAEVSLLGQTIESAEIADETITAADTATTFLTQGSGVTITRNAASWQIDAAGSGGTITSVTAGAGLTGGGSSGGVTLDVGAGTGIVVAVDAISADAGTGPNQLVQLDAGGALPAVSGVNLTSLNAATLSTGTVDDARLSSSVSLLGGTIESAEVAESTLTAADTAGDFLTAGLGVTIVKGATSWDISAVGSGGDITGVTAGTGLSGGGDSGTVTLALATPVAVANGGTGAGIVSEARANLGAAANGANTDITSLGGLTTALSVAQGGTGSTTAAGARANLAAAASGANSDITSLTGLTTALSVAQGGTGAATAAAARANLGAAASGANSDITSLSGLTSPLSVAQGGTGASTLTAGGVLLGQGTSAVSATGVLAKGSLLVGDGVTDPTSLPVGTDGSLLRADSAQTSGLKWTAGCLPIGGTDDGSRTATFQVAAFGVGGTNNRQDRLWPVPVAGAVSTLRAFVGQAPGTGDSWTVTVRKNAANTALSCTISGAGQTCTDSGPVSVAAGDRLGVEFVEGGTAAGTQGAGWSTCFIPD